MTAYTFGCLFSQFIQVCIHSIATWVLEADIFNHLFIIFIYFNLFAHLLPSLLHTFHHKVLC